MSVPVARPRQTTHHATFVVLTVAVASFELLQSLVVPMLGKLQVELHTTQTTVTWVLTAYLLSASVCAPLLGRIGDVVGKKRMLVLTLAALAVGSLLAGLAQDVTWLIVARVVQGVGGGVLPLSFGIIRDQFPRERGLADSDHGGHRDVPDHDLRIRRGGRGPPAPD